MKRNEIISMAMEAGCNILTIPGVGKLVTYNDMRVTNLLERFADLVAAAEREKCAKVCQAVVDSGMYDGRQQYAAAACRDEIRCMNKQEQSK